VLCESGTPVHTFAEAFVRLFFSLFDLATFLVLVYRMVRTFHSCWMLEQVFSAGLLLIALISNNPFYILHLISPSPLHLLVAGVADPLFQSSIFVTVLLNLDLLRSKILIHDYIALAPKLRFGAVVWLIGATINAHEFMKQFQIPDLRPDRIETWSRWLQIGVSLVFCAFALYSVGLASLYIHSRDIFKFVLNLYSAFLIVAVGCVLCIVNLIVDTIDGAEVIRMISFSFFNVFVLFNAFVRWPRDQKKSQYYDNVKRTVFNHTETTHEEPIGVFESVEESLSEFGIDLEERLDL
jgi:hypothetical protein